jgi:3-oxoacyl-[acyl-carrier-protein] synthase-1
MTGKKEDICITALGMATALAPTMVDSCAAFHAGVKRASELNTVDPNEEAALGEEPIVACRASYLTEGYTSGAKLVLLGGIALSDLLHRRPLSNGERARTGIVVHLSDCFLLDAIAESPEAGDEDQTPSELWQSESPPLVSRMLAQSYLHIAGERQYLTFGGHAAFVKALQAAADLIANHQLDRCIVGAVDSCLDPEFLLAAAVQGLLKTPENPVGFVPGEAACFALLERTADTRRSRTPSLALFDCGPWISGKFDRFSEEPPDGADLARTIQELLTRYPREIEVGLVIGDLNGDEYRALIWGNAIARLGNKHDLANVPMLIPALGFGETGSAAGALGFCLAVRAIEHDRARHGACLVWLWDESGAQSALMLAPTPGAEREV